MAERNAVEELVNRARSGDRQAFDDLAATARERLAASIRSWSKFQLGPGPDVEDVLQETLVRAYRTLGRFEWQDDDSFFRWLCGIAKHALAQAALDARKVQRGKQHDRAPATADSPSKGLRREERFERLEAALAKLSPEHQEAITLSRLDGLTSVEVAKRMNRSPAAIRQLLVRALRELKKNFGDTESFHLPDRRLEAKRGGNVE